MGSIAHAGRAVANGWPGTADLPWRGGRFYRGSLVEQMLAHGLPVLGDVHGRPLQLLGEPSASLAAIAAWLRVHGHAAPWRNELTAVVTVDGRRIGCVERAVVRNLGRDPRRAAPRLRG